MSARKTPVLLREGPFSGRIFAWTNYRKVTKDTDMMQVVGNGKHDVTADFDALVCELLLNPAPRIIEQLDGAAKGMELSKAERKEIRAFRKALVVIVARHNAGPHVQKDAA